MNREENPRPPQTRRAFLKGSAMALAGAGAAWVSADKLQQVARELTFNKEKMKGLSRVIEEIKGMYSDVDQWFDSTAWATSIVSACEKNNVPGTNENVTIVLTIIRSSSGFRVSPRSYDNLPTPSESTIRDISPIEPKTGGPMEVSYGDVAKKRRLTHEQAVNFIDTRDGGIESGVEELRGILDLYSSVENEELRLKCIFADWNAGPGSSITAGIQRYINKIAGTNLAEDGVMGPQAIALFEKYRTKIEEAKIEPVPAASPVRGLIGVVKKVLTGVGTSRDYADKRFQDYLKIKNLMSNYRS